MKQEIDSPCVKICIFDNESGYCLGCSRTADEVEMRGKPETSNEWKLQNLKDLKEREQ